MKFHLFNLAEKLMQYSSTSKICLFISLEMADTINSPILYAIGHKHKISCRTETSNPWEFNCPTSHVMCHLKSPTPNACSRVNQLIDPVSH